MSECIKYFVEAVFGLAMFVNAVLFIPQALRLYKVKNTKGLSIVTFIGFNFIQFFTVLHGYIQKDYVLMYGNILSLFLAGTVTFLIVLYRKNK
jgi:MtN3 and saliva related transmembrane protein